MGPVRRRTTALIGAALVAAFILTGCSSGASDHASSSGGAPALSQPKAAAPEQGAAADQQGMAAQGKDQAAEAPDLSVDQRSIIYTGSMTIQVGDVDQAAARATAIAIGAGGFVGGDKRNTGNGSSDATLELRIPAAKFQSVVDELAKTLGTEQQRAISTEDVTEQTVDLDARIAVQQARVASARNLLSRAKTLDDLVMLEKEVASRESDLASLQAKKRRLADLTALSTITVVLLHPAAVVVKKNDQHPGFLAGLSGGWTALLAALGVVLTVLGALLPWLVALGLPAWAIFLVYRRYQRRRRPAAPVPAFATAGAPAPAYPPHPQQPRPEAAPGPQGNPVPPPERSGKDDGGAERT